jgi:hypothetical protein
LQFVDCFTQGKSTRKKEKRKMMELFPRNQDGGWRKKKENGRRDEKLC